MNAEQLSIEAVRLADEFFARRLWRRLDSEQMFTVQAPGLPPIAACVMGSSGSEHGMALYVGETAVEDLMKVEAGQTSLRNLASDVLSFTLTRRIDIVPPFDRPLVAAKRQGRMAPFFMRALPTRELRPFRKSDYEALLWTLQAVLETDAADRFEPGRPLDTGQYMVLHVTGGDWRDPQIRIESRSLDPTEQAEGTMVPDARAIETTEGGSDFEVASLRGMRVLPAVEHVCGIAEIPAPIAGRQTIVETAILYDKSHDDLRCMEVLPPGDPQDVLASAVAAIGEALASGPGLPAVLASDDERLLAALAPHLRPAGVRCEWRESISEIDEIVDETHDFASAVDDEPPAEAGSYEGWKQADRFVSALLQEAEEHGALDNARAWRRYVGRDTDLEAILARHGEYVVHMYLTSFALYYRATARSRTIAQRLLDRDLPEPVRALLVARMQAPVSFHRVERVDVGEGVELLDLASARRIFVHDQQLSMSAVEGIVFAASTYAAGPYRFVQLLSPALPPMHADRLLQRLSDEARLPSDAAIPPARVHQLGVLWSWCDEAADSPIRLQNHDGDTIELHEALYAVADRAALVTALEARDDVSTVAADREWNWLDDARTIHASLELDGSELSVTTNSAVRHEAARSWLTTIEGVDFVRVERMELDLDRAEPPAPTTGPVERFDPDSLADIQRVVDEKIISMLDEPIPMLGNQSPRELCRTPAGRARARQWIETYPDPGGIPALRAPRDKMLRALGLDAESEHEAGEA